MPRTVLEPIAVIGSSCRFPGHSTSPSKLWELLSNPVDLHREIPKHRFDAPGFFHPDGEHHGTSDAVQGYFLEEDHRVFDASFFSITPKEAEALDPQQKMLLECTYEALESSGRTIQECNGKPIGVFVGAMTVDYATLVCADMDDISQYAATGTARSIMSNRISYFFNWSGPSMTIDTACSSSLVAVHQAVLSLRSGETDMCCASGVTLLLTPENFIAESSLHMLSPTGTSKMWDAGADGYSRGEGVGCLMLKTLSKALADGDEIEYIIRETGVNSDGRSKGITMPSPEAQTRLIREVYARAGLDASKDRPQFFEAHGTGTQAGDPREAEAIHTAFFGPVDAHNSDNPPDRKLIVGSIKTIIGHTEGAAGIAGMMKASLAMKHGIIPANMHLHNVNPTIKPFMNNLEVPTAPMTWPAPASGQPLRASVNSFGFGGTNAHALLEKYDPLIHNEPWAPAESLAPLPASISDSADGPPCNVVFYSARSGAALRKMVRAGVEDLLGRKESQIRNITYTHAFRRSVFPYKIAFAGADKRELLDKMGVAFRDSESANDEFGVRSKPGDASNRILGIFTGQGAQWPTMGKELLSSSPLFSATIDTLDDDLRRCPDPPSWTIREELQKSPETSQLHRAMLAQPLCTAIQIALVDLLRASGVQFHTVVGHSSGEIGAAYASGVLNARDAILIAYYRGIHATSASGPAGKKGSMLAVGLSIDEAIDLCEGEQFRGRIYVAATNSPASITLSGDIDAILECKAVLDGQKKFARAVKVDSAYHSHHMDPCSAAYKQALLKCGIRPRLITELSHVPVWVSSVYGPIGAPSLQELSASYWRDNMLQPVLFTEALDRALRERGPFDVALELGPHPALKGPATQTMQDAGQPMIPYAGALFRNSNDLVAFTEAAALLWSTLGPTAINLEKFLSATGFQSGQAPKLVKDLPTYPWDHDQMHYRDSRLARQYLQREAPPHELLGVRTRDDADSALRWRNILQPNSIAWLKHHRFQGQLIVPAAAYCIMALDAARFLGRHHPISMVELLDVEIDLGITMPDDSPGVETLFAITAEDNVTNNGHLYATWTLDFTAVTGERRMRRAVAGRVLIHRSNGGDHSSSKPSRRIDTYKVSEDSFYTNIGLSGLGYTGPFRALTNLHRRHNYASADLQKPNSLDESTLTVRPALLDSSFQVGLCAFGSPGDGSLWGSFLPKSFKSIRFALPLCEAHSHTESQVSVEAYITEHNDANHDRQANFHMDIELFNPAGEQEIQIEGLVVEWTQPLASDDRELYLHTIYQPDAGDVLTSPTSLLGSSPQTPTWASETARIAAFYSDGANPSSHEMDELIQRSPYRPTLELIRTFGEEKLSGLIPGLAKQLEQESLELAAFNQEIGRVLAPISHRYPRLKLLELDPLGSGRSTPGLLHSLAGAYSVYTYAHATASSPSHLRPGEIRNFVPVKVDAGERVSEQLGQGVADVVVVSQLASGEGEEGLGDKLRDLRELLVPGGFLILLEFADNLLRERLLRVLQGGAQAAPQVDPMGRLEGLLERSGFSGVRHRHRAFGNACNLAVVQAMDDTVAALVNPLCAPRDVFALEGGVLIVGGKTADVRGVVQGVRDHLDPLGLKVVHAESLTSVQPATVKDLGAVIFLADLDEPILANMTQDKMDKLTEVLKPNRFVLWVTSGFREENPYHYGSMGFGRTLKLEVPQLFLQYLDLDNPRGQAAVTHITEAFLRVLVARSTDLSHHLWSVEQELVVTQDKIQIPRVVPTKDLNDRSNSVRRLISNEINPKHTPVTLERLDGVAGTSRYVAKHTNETPADLVGAAANGHEDTILVRVMYSTLLAYNVAGSGRWMIGIGEIEGGQRVLTAMTTSASYVAVPRSWTFPLSDQPTDGKTLIQLLVRAIVARSVLDSPEQRSGGLLIHEADTWFAKILRYKLKEDSAADRELHFSTAHTAKARQDRSFILIGEQTTQRTKRSILPHSINTVIDLTVDNQRRDTFLGVIPGCPVNFADALMHSSASPSIVKVQIGAVLGAIAEGLERMSLSSIPSDTTTVNEIVGTNDIPPFTVIDWSASTSVPSAVRTLDPNSLFSQKKTYLLVGLNGDLGQSMCKFMITHGARNVVIVSRNPDVNAPWKSELESLGGVITVARMDASNLADVRRLRAELASTHPPIAGIVNGAMVLADGFFQNLSVADFQRALSPKIDGSKNLDIAFGEQDLDFFIMLSSLTGIPGNSGQSNYTAANMYMAGLAGNRRKRGLAASVIDIGLVYGIGYVNRIDGAAIYQNLERQGFRPISERDIHSMLVEGIAASRIASSSPYQISTGLSRFSLTDKNPLPWHTEPRFSHLVLGSEFTVNASGDGPAQSLEEELAECTSEAAISAVLRKSFSAQLEAMLQLDAGGVTADTPIIDLGADSLVAVKIRSWFLKEVKKDMPVLQILSGATVAGLVDEVVPDLYAEQQSNARAMRDTPVDISSDEDVSSSSADDSSYDDGSTDLTSGDETDSLREIEDELHYEKIANMTPGQARLWLPYLILEDKSAYNCTTTYRLTGEVDVGKLERAIQRACHRHEAFRTAYFTDPSTGESMQAVKPHSKFRLEHRTNVDDNADVEAAKKWSAEYKYDLEDGDVFIAMLLTHSPTHHTIVYGYHHIMIDAVSWQIFLQDIEKYYREPSLRLPPPKTFIDFAQRVTQTMDSKPSMEKRTFWKNEFASIPEPLPLFPFAKVNNRRSLKTYTVREKFVELDSELAAGIRAAAAEQKGTPFHLYLAALTTLLNRWLKIDDICLGMTDANRSDAEYMNTVGFMLETLPVRLQVDSSSTFAEHIGRTRDKVYGALGGSGIPLDTILNDIGAETAATHSPLFQVLVNYRPGSIQQKSIGDVGMEYVSYEDAGHPFDFVCSIDEDDGRAAITLSVQEYMYDDAGIDLFMDTYIHLLEQFSKNVQVRLADMPVLSPRMQDRAIAFGRGGELPKPIVPTLSHRVDDMAERYPHEPALKSGSITMTYSDMAKRLQEIQAALQSMGAGPGSRIAMFCEKSPDAIISLLAILRTGGTYIPLDSRNDDTRLTTIAVESEAQIVVCDSHTRGRLDGYNLRVQVCDVSKVRNGGTLSRVDNRATPTGIAFMMYTSGTTGKPKGIQLTHSNMATHIAAASSALSLQRETVLQQSAFGYDASLAQTFYALANGGTLVLSSNRLEMDELAKAMRDERVTLTLMAPSEYLALFQNASAYLEGCHQWRIALCGGEAFPLTVKRGFRRLHMPTLQVWNEYGPTEVSVASSVHRVDYQNVDQDDDAAIPIGRPMPGYDVYLLDDALQPVPLGWPGQIAVASAAVSTGYFHNESLTEAKFIRNSVTPGEDGPRSRLYLTGDMGRMLVDGSTVHLGRMEQDTQIKLRGIRMELSEIADTMMLQADGIIANAVVGARGEGVDQFLVAYVVFTSGRRPSQEDESQYLASLLSDLPLPVYMRPAKAISLDSMPMDASGKLDRRRLAALPLRITASRPIESQSVGFTSAENRLCAIWLRILGHTGITVDKSSNFFAVGGTSLSLLTLQAEIKKEFHVKVPLPELFNMTTLSALAARLSSSPQTLDDSPQVTTAPTPSHTHFSINWRLESEVQPSSIPSPLSPSPPNPDPRISVLITGTTGFLGRYLVQELASCDFVSTVHCIAVRSPSSASAQALVSLSPKVVLHPGDLSSPDLGLDPASSETPLASCDAVIHNGADVSFLKPYPALPGANVGSTKALAALARKHGMAMHYISTAGVGTVLKGAERIEESSVSGSEPEGEGVDGYVQSKWVSEKFLENWSEKTGEKVRVYRPSTIRGEDAPELDIVNNVLSYSRKLGATPRLEGWEGAFDLIDVQVVAREIVNGVLAGCGKGREGGGGGVEFVHMSGQKVVPVGEVRSFFAGEWGRELEELEMGEWTARARAAGMHELVKQFLEAQAAQAVKPALPRLASKLFGR